MKPVICMFKFTLFFINLNESSRIGQVLLASSKSVNNEAVKNVSIVGEGPEILKEGTGLADVPKNDKTDDIFGVIETMKRR